MNYVKKYINLSRNYCFVIKKSPCIGMYIVLYFREPNVAAASSSFCDDDDDKLVCV